jgi:hypothetical protein
VSRRHQCRSIGARWRVAGVLAFYCLLEVFDYDGRSRSLGTHLVFFRNLFTLS